MKIRKQRLVSIGDTVLLFYLQISFFAFHLTYTRNFIKDEESEDAIMQEKEKNELEKYESKMSRKERQAMERFANFMAEMILKYGPKVLAEIEAEEERKKEE